MPTMGSLFAGIGGFDLGFERGGFDVAWQVEIDPYCRKVLARHFPKAERFEDVRECGKHNLRPVDVICGGFPCQDISVAGKGAGIDGERSGLWSEYARIIGELRPRFVVVENVAALLGRGMGRVLGQLSEIGYDAEWQIISAADVGAPHLRERVWIVAYAESQQDRRLQFAGMEANTGTGGEMADAKIERLQRGRNSRDGDGMSGARVCAQSVRSRSDVHREDVAYSHGDGHDRSQWDEAQPSGDEANDRLPIGDGESVADASSAGLERQEPAWSEPGESGLLAERGWWATEPNVGRVAHGVPARVDRLRGLGNAVVPQIPEMIAEQILRFIPDYSGSAYLATISEDACL